MKNEQLQTRTNKYREYRESIKVQGEEEQKMEIERAKEPQVVNYSEPQIKETPRHIESPTEKSESPYRIYRNKQLAKGILYGLFFVIVTAGLVMLLLVFANYLGMKIW